MRYTEIQIDLFTFLVVEPFFWNRAGLGEKFVESAWHFIDFLFRKEEKSKISIFLHKKQHKVAIPAILINIIASSMYPSSTRHDITSILEQKAKDTQKLLFYQSFIQIPSLSFNVPSF